MSITITNSEMSTPLVPSPVPGAPLPRQNVFIPIHAVLNLPRSLLAFYGPFDPDWDEAGMKTFWHGGDGGGDQEPDCKPLVRHISQESQRLPEISTLVLVTLGDASAIAPVCAQASKQKTPPRIGSLKELKKCEVCCFQSVSCNATDADKCET